MSSDSLECEKKSLSSPHRLCVKVVVVLSSPILKRLGDNHGVAELLGSSRAITSKRVVPAGMAFPSNYSKKRLVPSVTGRPFLGTNIMKYGKSGLLT